MREPENQPALLDDATKTLSRFLADVGPLLGYRLLHPGKIPVPLSSEMDLAKALTDALPLSVRSWRKIGQVLEGDSDHAENLIVFAIRMCSLAVRHSDSDQLTVAALAFSLEEDSGDSRSVWVAMSAFCDAAARLGVDPINAVEPCVERAPTKRKRLIRRIAANPPSLSSLCSPSTDSEGRFVYG